MKRQRPRAACAILVGASLLLSGCSLWGAAARMPDPRAGSIDGLRVVAFYDDRDETKKGVILDTLLRNKSLVTDLSPFWYKINRDGSITDMSENDVRSFAERNGIRLVPLVTNQAGNDAFLKDAATRGKAISALLGILDRNSAIYDGFSIDFQLLEPGSRDNLTAFMKELYPKVKRRGKLLNIDVIPTGQATNRSSPYDLANLARNSDAIVLMTYDNHSTASGPGAVAGLEWVRSRVLAAEAAGVKPAKLMMGVAAYGYDWTPGTSKTTTVSMKETRIKVRELGARVERAKNDLSPHFTYTDKNGVKHTVWFEDGMSAAQKVRLARDMHLRGIAIWHVGQEDQSYWDALRSALR